MTENFSNEFQTTLNGAINDSTTSVVVTSATGAPAANFRIRIGAEYMLVTAVAGTTFTVTRGLEGSTAAAHSNLATVTHVLTAGGLIQKVAESGGGGGGTPAFAGAKAYAATTQSIPNSATTAVAFPLEEYDTDAFHDLVTNNARLTVPAGKAGKYLLQGGTYIGAAPPTSTETLFRKNGTTLIRSAAGSIGDGGWALPHATADLAEGDYVELIIYQNSGSAKTIGSTAGLDNQSWAAISLLGGGGSSAFVGCIATRTTDQTGIVTATNTPVLFTGTDEEDSDAFHDPAGANPERITIPSGKAGVYHFTAGVIWDGSATGQRRIMIFKNGAEVHGGTQSIGSLAGTLGYSMINTGVTTRMAVGDYATVVVAHNDGSNRTLSGSVIALRFEAVLVGT